MFLFSYDYLDNIVAKVSDFGLVQFSVGKQLISNKVSPNWAAPELLKQKELSTRSDVYSFGSILYELLTGDLPYDPNQNAAWRDPQSVVDTVLQGIRPSYSIRQMEQLFQVEIPPKAIEMLEACWSVEPASRPTFSSLAESLASILHMQHLHPQKDIVSKLPPSPPYEAIPAPPPEPPKNQPARMMSD